jgi:hypothetical protein
VLKNPPLAAPLIITNTINGPSEFDTGHKTSILNALMIRDSKRVFTGPMKSDRSPQHNRPTADEKLNPATRPAPADAESPREAAYNGRKKGGTNKGKVAMAPAKKSTVNWLFLKSRLHLVSHFLKTGSRDIPFDQGGGSNWGSFLNQPRSWETGGQSYETNDAESPFWTKLLDQAIHGKADCCASYSSSCVDYTVR